MEERYLSKFFDIDRGWTIDVFEKHGGYSALRKAVKMEPQTIIDEMRTSNLRGRGGAGFPTGVKWGFIPKESDLPKYLTINADEGEPGTFKDIKCMELDPHRLIEGAVITAWTLKIRYGYIFIRGEMGLAIRRLQQAVAEARERGYLGKNILGTGLDFDLYVHPGAGAYICGEETGMIEGLEGKPGQPRMKPPFPALIGLFNCPTLVNNVETISSVPFIVERGGQWWADMGRGRTGGPKLYGMSGRVNRPGVVEAPSGITIRELLEEHAGGMQEGYELKAIIPGGSSCAVMLPDKLDTHTNIDAMREAGSSLGTACMTFVDHTTCMVRLAARLGHFYHHESCGQCTPCREGTGWGTKVLDQIEAGQGRPADLALIDEIMDNIEGNTICALGDSMAIPVRSYVEHFRHEFEQHIREGRCSFPAWRRRRGAGSGQQAGAPAARAASTG